MDFATFKNELMEHVTNEIESRGLENISLKYDVMNSPDGVTDRLIVSVGDSKMSMAFRLNDVFRDVNNAGESIECAANRMVNTIEANIDVVKTKENDVKRFISDYDSVRKHTFLRLVPGSSPILNDTPHRMIEDMALVVNINIESLSDEHGRSCVVVSKPLLDMYGIEEKELFADAEKNSIEKEPLVLKPLEDVVRQLIGSDEDHSTENAGIVTYIATNKSAFHGASVVAYPDFAERVAEAIGGSFYLIPSSVHEFLILKDDGTPKAEDLNGMIKNINETVLEPRDILSSECYHYHDKTQVLETGLEYEHRTEDFAGKMAS